MLKKHSYFFFLKLPASEIGSQCQFNGPVFEISRIFYHASVDILKIFVRQWVLKRYFVVAALLAATGTTFEEISPKQLIQILNMSIIWKWQSFLFACGLYSSWVNIFSG